MTHSQDAIWQQVYSSQWYQTHHPQLVQARELAKRLCRELNQLPMSEVAKRQKLLSQLLPNVKNIDIGSDFACDYGIHIYTGDNVTMGSRVVILDAAPVSIGANVTIEDGVVIASLTHPLEAAKRKAGWQQASPVKIGDNVVLSEGCTILPGAVIPAGAVIEPGKVVTR
ncbi:MAG: maltose O-acetyltransferase [Gammaproteobacteria bacterium]|nr:maltose O-acetyltransferase [Gammaproteobacteria bacterium]